MVRQQVLLLVSVCIGCMTWIGAPALGDSVPPTPAELTAKQRIDLEVRAGMYIPRFSGEAMLGSGLFARDLDLQEELDLSDRAETLNVELAFGRDRWKMFFGGFDAGVEGRGVMPRTTDFGDVRLAAGDSFESSLDLTTVSAELRYAAWHPYRKDDTGDVALTISPVLGMRWMDIDMEVVNPGGVRAGRARAGGEWLGLYLGGAVTFSYDTPALPVLKRFDLDAAFSAGPVLGGDGGTAWQIRGSIMMYVSDDVFLEVGYRLVEFDVENDDFAFAGGSRGLFIGVGVEF